VKTMQLLVRNLLGETLVVDAETCPDGLDVAALKDRLTEREGIPAEDMRLMAGKQDLDLGEGVLSLEEAGALPTIHMLLRLDGGKGGFGSMLRMLGKNTKANTDNVDACRDIHGRRLRHVNSEKKLMEWYAMEDERKAQEELEKKEKRVAANDLKREILALEKDSVVKDCRAVTADISDAVKQGLLNKKRKAKLASTAASSDPSAAGSAGPSGGPAPAQEPAEPSESSPKKRRTEAPEEPAAAPTPAPEEKPKEFDPIDLQKIATNEDLQALGLEHLKAELTTRKLKCGGTLEQRAERLWTVRGPPELLGEDVPMELRAGVSSKKKKNTGSKK